MISTYDWKCWDLFTWDLVHVHHVYLDPGLSIRQNTENMKQMEKMPPHRKTGFPGVTRCRLSRTPVALVQVAQNPCRTKMVKALQVRWSQVGGSPVTAVLSNRPLPRLVLRRAERDRAVCWCSGEATSGSRGWNTKKFMSWVLHSYLHLSLYLTQRIVLCSVLM